MIARLVFLATLALSGTTLAQTGTVPGEEAKPKLPAALTEKQVRELKSGEVPGLARTAEAHGWPSPARVTGWAADLDLTDEQARDVLIARKRLQASSRKTGAEIIAKEQELDAAFADGTIIPDELTRLTFEIGYLYGRLRAAHLYASMEMKTLLTPEQLERYREIAGAGERTAGRQ
ncbi:MAG: hypothetical protein M3O22_00115 [Pseudomonadota bacterium]|nr:hypothetical protein [Pseudomonadota bacterium]